MSDATTWRRLTAPQDALLWWLTPAVAARLRMQTTAAIRWADANLRGPADLSAWEERTASVPGVSPLTVAAYVGALPILMAAMRRPPSGEAVAAALRHGDLQSLPPGLPPILPPEAGPPAPPGGQPPWRGFRLTPDMRRAMRWANYEAAANVTKWADEVRQDLRWQVVVGIRQGRTDREQAAVLRERYHTWGVDFERVAITETASAFAAGRLLGYPDGAKVRAILAPDACEDCKRLLDGKTFTVRRQPGDPWTEVWPGKSNAGLRREGLVPTIPLHPRCVPGDTHVLAEGVSAASKRWYDGDLLVISTASGKRLACTPNHPILTPRGWVPASLLHVGGYVISGGVAERVGLGEDNHEDVPPTIHEVADALAGSSEVASAEVPVAAEDFHGDGIDGSIAVVWANRHGGHDPYDAAAAEHLAQYELGWRHVEPLVLGGLCPHGLLVFGVDASSHGVVRGLREAHALLGAGLGHSGIHRLAASPGLYAGICEAPADDAARHAVVLGERLLGGASDVGGHYLRGGHFAPARLEHTGRLQDRGYLQRSDPEMPGGFLDSVPGGVESDEIIRIESSSFSGHVYNLQTRTGVFLANGIVTHNCRCVWVLDQMPR